MKNLYKFLLALAVQISVFAQIAEITRLPVQDISQSIKESVPVWLSENEIMIFYVNETKDTIFSTQSTNRGLNWSQPKFQFKVELLQQTQELIYPAVLKTKSGRLIFAWSVLNKGINLTYSDDNGEIWLPIQIIYGTGPDPTPPGRRIYYLKLSQLDDERIILCYNIGTDGVNLYYKESLDNGENWNGTPIKIARTGGYNFLDHSIISAEPGKLMCVFLLKRLFQPSYNIYSMFSDDNGISWSDTINISGYASNEAIPRISRDGEGNLWLTYLRNDIVTFGTNINYNVGNVFYRKSTDGGFNWTGEQQLTHFIGDDNYPSLNTAGAYPFLTYSTVKFTGSYQVAYGILGETVETYTPPAIFNSYSLWGSNPDSLIIQAYVKDDNAVESVKLYFEDSQPIFELFDDGMHNDLEAGDGIYGNKVMYDINRDGNAVYLNVNKLKIPFSNKGVIADVQVRDTVNTTFLLNDFENNTGSYLNKIIIAVGSLGKYEEGSFLFSSGFFLSGYSNGTLWSNAVASASLVLDYEPGTVGSNPSDPKFNFYTVRKEDTPFGSSWQRWKDAVNLGAPFYDGDGDGIYNPVDKNFNGTWDPGEDMPFLIGDVTAWCVFNDAVPRNMRRWNTVDPQGIEVRQTIFAADKPDLENVIFIHYSVLNTGTAADIMDSVYFGIWTDADIGDFNDDVIGCDTLLSSGFYYGNQPDAVYGINPPSFFKTFLQGPIVSTGNQMDTAYNYWGEIVGREQITGATNLPMSSHVFYIGGDPDLRVPANATEARNYLEGKMRTGLFPNPCTFPYAEVRGGINCNDVNKLFWVSGDPVTDVGWIRTGGLDHRNMINTGPFQLEKDKPQDILVAYVIGRGTDYFNSITVARENVQRAIQEYKSNFASMTYTAPPPTNPVTSYVLYQNYPNPFNPTTTIRFELPQDGIVTIELYDILGQKVRTILNEFKNAGRYEVEFSAKGGSASGGNSTGLASGVYIYQLRVNDFITSKKMVLIR